MTYFGYKVINGFRSHTPRGFYDAIRGHTGIDIKCPVGTPLAVPWPTTCVEARAQNQMGMTIYLEDKNGDIAVFAHLSAFKVKKNDEVLAGQLFGISGNSGTRTTAPHVHYEVVARHAEKGNEDMYRSELAPFKGFNVDPESYWLRMSRTSAIVAAFQRMSAGLRKIYAKIHRNKQ